MPDSNGRLTSEEVRILLGWLKDQWQGASCPMHRGMPTNWEVGDMIMTLPYTGAGVSIGGPTYPLVVVTCAQCGYTVLVNAIKAGIVRVPQPAQPVQPEPQPEPQPPHEGN